LEGVALIAAVLTDPRSDVGQQKRKQSLTFLAGMAWKPGAER